MSETSVIANALSSALSPVIEKFVSVESAEEKAFNKELEGLTKQLEKTENASVKKALENAIKEIKAGSQDFEGGKKQAIATAIIHVVKEQLGVSLSFGKKGSKKGSTGTRSRLSEKDAESLRNDIAAFVKKSGTAEKAKVFEKFTGDKATRNNVNGAINALLEAGTLKAAGRGQIASK